jgi:hypothetical protein
MWTFLTATWHQIQLFTVPAVAITLWEFYKFLRGRSFQNTLIIDVTTSSQPSGERSVVFVDVQLKNLGKGRIKAKRIGDGEYAYKDEIEQLKHSCGLQVRKINTASVTTDAHLDWFQSSALERVEGIPDEINLLDEYILTDKNNVVEFWLEPGETVHLPAPLLLSSGHYLLKVSFYGPRHSDFWSYIAYVHVL